MPLQAEGECRPPHALNLQGSQLLCPFPPSREGRLYLVWLMKQIEQLGGRHERRHVSSLDELADYDAVVNCTGAHVVGLHEPARGAQPSPAPGTGTPTPFCIISREPL